MCQSVYDLAFKIYYIHDTRIWLLKTVFYLQIKVLFLLALLLYALRGSITQVLSCPIMKEGIQIYFFNLNNHNVIVTVSKSWIS